MTVIASLITSLGLDSSAFKSGLKEATRSMKGAQKQFANVGANMAKVGAVMTVGLTAPFTALVSEAIPAARESAQALAQVNAALTSMGPVAGKTSAELQGMAGHLQDISLFDDDDILKSVTANLLTFGKVGGEVFERAQLAAVNLSARLGQDLQASALQVGKALNDPVKGVTALQRVGVSFTAQQREQIAAMSAAGDAAGAQAIILGELERQFGGAAQAQRDATPTAAMDQAWRTFNEAVGGVAMEVLPNIANGLASVLNAFNQLSPATQTGIVAFAAVAAALGPVIAGVGAVVTGIGALLPVLAAMSAGFTATAMPAIVAFGALLAPILAPIAAVAGAIALVVAAVRHWDEIKASADRVVGFMSNLYQGVKTWISDKLNAVWDGLRAKIDAAKGWFFGLYDAVVGHSYIPDMVDEIGQHMARLDANMVQPVAAATDAARQAFEALGQRVAPILDRLFPDQAKTNQFRRDMADLLDFAKKAGWTAAQTEEAIARLRKENGGASGGAAGGGESGTAMPGVLTPEELEKWGDAAEKSADRVIKANERQKVSWAETMRDALGSVRGFVDGIRNGDIFGAIQSVLDLIGQIGGIIRGTGTPAVRTFDVGGGIAGARAAGGPVLPRRSYLVGERGPEILRMGGQSGSIVPNDQIGGVANVTIAVEEGALFRPVVRSEAGAVSVQTVSVAQRRVQMRGRQVYA